MVRPMTALTSAQKRKLKSLAQRLEPVVRLGKHGVSEAFLQSLREALEHHELVKIRFEDFQDERKQLAPEIALRSESQFIWMVGHVAVFFRQNPDPAKQKIALA